jgi:hypothetical protein
MFYNWVRIHKTLRVTPAMAAGLTTKLLSMEDVAAMIEAAAAKPDRPFKTGALEHSSQPQSALTAGAAISPVTCADVSWSGQDA